MSDSLQNLLDFTTFTHDIRQVKRAMWVKDEDVYENDSEHGYQLALVAMYVIQANKLKLDTFRAMGIALVHDVLEVHSGDTPLFSATEVKSTQKEREAEAIKQLKQQWPNLTLMHKLIDEYETKATPEGKFIYALDKLVPMLNNILDNGRNWRRQNVDLEHVISAKTGKIDVDPTVNQYYKQVLKHLRNTPELFS